MSSFYLERSKTLLLEGNVSPSGLVLSVRIAVYPKGSSKRFPIPFGDGLSGNCRKTREICADDVESESEGWACLLNPPYKKADHVLVRVLVVGCLRLVAGHPIAQMNS
jgi:hypothetical protein